MKQLLLAIFLLPMIALGQDSYSYGTLEDLLADEPTSAIPATFRYERQRHSGKLRGKKIAAHRFKGPRGEKLPKGKTFAVYMDGFLFINPDRPRLRKQADFFKVEWIGDFGYFVSIDEYPVWMDGNSTNGNTWLEETVLKEKLLYRSTGRIINLTRRNLREILQNRPQLLRDFELEKNKKRKLKEYLVLYHQKIGQPSADQRS